MVRPLWRLPSIALRERRHGEGRGRVPEPMVMDEPESVAQFHAGGEASPGMQAVYDFSARALNALLPEGSRLLDLGVGSGRALAHLMRLRPDLEATAVDLAPNMLAAARELFEVEGTADRIELVEADITALPDAIVDRPFDGVSCVWTLHQLPDLETLRGRCGRWPRCAPARGRRSGSSTSSGSGRPRRSRPWSRCSTRRCPPSCARTRWPARPRRSRAASSAPS